MREKVEEALAAIRPALQADGGDVELVNVDGGKVEVRLKGACADCPMSVFTVYMLIEQSLKERVPEVTEVVPV
jgi:Fe-S cluster biogenesis protein NfuA